jgi:class 3 adenylate cyclase/tetratricopeptide (TPR) repeat protein
VSTCPTCHAPAPPESRFCSHCGHALGASDPLEGERKVATVVFADVAGSTGLAESLDPEDWAAVMNGAFGFMNAAVSRYGGTVGRLMGDAVLAFFGAPIAHEDHAERAVRAALEIRDAAESYAATLRERHGIEFGVRVGVSTGTAVLAVLGDAVRAEYTAMGDTANTAARLQGAARPGTVLISRDTRDLVRGQFVLEAKGPVALKGKRDAVEAFEVVSARSQPAKLRGIEGVWSPLVGREAELGALRGTVEGLRAGRGGGVVAVVGEAGLGKSRLVAELREALEGTPDLVWFEGRSLSYGQALPYHPWTQIGRQFIQAEPGDGPAVIREKLARFVERMALPQEHLPFYETMMAVESEASLEALAEYEGEARVAAAGDAVLAAVKAGMNGGGAATRCVLVFDDIHWADRASLELVARITSLVGTHPLLVLCVMRPDRRAGSRALMDRLEHDLGDRFQRIELRPLSADDAELLLSNLAGRESLPSGFRSKILARSDGNPFFLEEVLRAQIDGGHLVRDGDRLRPMEALERVAIPHSLSAVLAARIDQLPEATKRVAQAASVIGRIFPFTALQQVCRDAPAAERIDDIEPHLETLVAEQILRERTGSTREYLFKHALTCEAAYGLLLRSKRRRLHERTARALETLYPDRVDELAPVLAYHYHESDRPDRTAQYSLLAADRALRLFAVDEAVTHYDRAFHDLESLDRPPTAEFVDAIMGWVATRYKLNTYEGAIERLERAEAVARGAEDRERLARVLSWMGTVYVVMGRPSRAAPYLFESNDLATELGDEVLSIAPFFYASDAMVDHDPRAAAERLGRVVELARKHGVPEIEGHALAAKAVAHARVGEFDLAEENIALALAAADSGGHRVKEADVHIFVAVAYYDMGDVEKGLEHARIGAQMAHEENAVECACAGFYGVGVGNLERKELDEALSHFSLSKRLADTSGWRGYVNRIRAGAAVAGLEQGDPGALEELETALRNARAERDHYGAGVLAHRLARIHFEAGDPARAEPLLDAALAYYRDAGMGPYEARGLDLLARIRDAQGRPDEAATARRSAVRLRATFSGRATGPSFDRPDRPEPSAAATLH